MADWSRKLCHWHGLNRYQHLLLENWLWSDDLGNELDEISHHTLSTRDGYRLKWSNEGWLLSDDHVVADLRHSHLDHLGLFEWSQLVVSRHGCGVSGHGLVDGQGLVLYVGPCVCD